MEVTPMESAPPTVAAPRCSVSAAENICQHPVPRRVAKDRHVQCGHKNCGIPGDQASTPIESRTTASDGLTSREDYSVTAKVSRPSGLSLEPLSRWVTEPNPASLNRTSTSPSVSYTV